jgi:hypothetical protein
VCQIMDKQAEDQKMHTGMHATMHRRKLFCYKEHKSGEKYP